MQSEALEKIGQNINDDKLTYFEYNTFHDVIKIGEGGFGKVYKAEIISHSHRIDVVALKKFKIKKDLEKEVFILLFYAVLGKNIYIT